MPKKTTKEETNDVKVFVPGETKITTVTGDDCTIPLINWEKEIRLISVIESSLDALAESLKDTPNPDVTAYVKALLHVAPDKITEFVSIVTENPPDWVTKNLDLPTIFAVIVPLVRERFETILLKVAEYLPEAVGEPVVVPEDVATE